MHRLKNGRTSLHRLKNDRSSLHRLKNGGSVVAIGVYLVAEDPFTELLEA